MPDWGILRGRNNDAVEDSPRTLGRAPPSPPLFDEASPCRKASAPGNLKSDNHGVNLDHLTVFRTHKVEAYGDMFFKVSRFQRSRRYYAELRGSTILVYKLTNPDVSHTASVDDVMAVIPVHEYKIEIVDMGGDDSNPTNFLMSNNSYNNSNNNSNFNNNNGACSRVYITSQRYSDNMTMFIRVYGQSNINAWRTALGRLTSTPLPFLSSLTIESIIGRGGGGKVFVVKWKHDKKTYALKVIDKTHTFRSGKAFRHVASERILMEKIGRHPFLLPLQFAFQSDTNLFIGTPFCRGGDLASYMRHKGDNSPLPIPPPPSTSSPSPHAHGQYGASGASNVGASPSSVTTTARDKAWNKNQFKDKTNGQNGQSYSKKVYARLSEDQTRRIATEVILGLEHLHSCGIVYRDLKPENIFIGTDGHLLIGDYGLGKQLKDGDNIESDSDQALSSQDQHRSSNSTSTTATPSSVTNRYNNNEGFLRVRNLVRRGSGGSSRRMSNSNDVNKIKNNTSTGDGNDNDNQRNTSQRRKFPPRTMSICGTRNYLPPEMLHGRQYSYEADVWSLGIMLYRMLCGVFPFDGRRTKEVFHRIKKDKLRIPHWISQSAKELLVGLLEKRPERRMTLSMAKQCSFFSAINWKDILNKRAGPCIADVEMGASLQDALENFEVSKLQGITVGEYVSENHDHSISGLGAYTGNGSYKRGEKPMHRRHPKSMMIGFEYVWIGKDEGDVQPLGMKQASSGFAGLMSKLSSVEMEQQLPLSPRSPFTGAGK